MSKFAVRYKVGQGPSDADDDVVEVEAATFVTQGSFVDFYAEAARNMQGTLNPKGGVVYRVNQDLVADIRELP